MSERRIPARRAILAASALVLLGIFLGRMLFASPEAGSPGAVSAGLGVAAMALVAASIWVGAPRIDRGGPANREPGPSVEP